jgi:WD40 repeat protein
MESLCRNRENMTRNGSHGTTRQQEKQLLDEPILRLNTIAHTGPINRIATDRENRYLVTVSEDKTARVWSLPHGRLLAVLRVPIGEGDMGKLYAVAMTPDGATVVVGGWTSTSGTDENIYVFDRASGALQQRISGLPMRVLHLAHSVDGSLFVAALKGSNGIRVFDASNGYQPLPSDAAYGDSSYWADFDRQSRLVTTSDDGFIRLYAAGRYNSPASKVKGRGGKNPLSAVFSPDGQRVAVGYGDSAAVDLLSGKDLAFLQAVDTRGVVGPEISTTDMGRGRPLSVCRRRRERDSSPSLGEWRRGPPHRYRGRQRYGNGTATA